MQNDQEYNENCLHLGQIEIPFEINTTRHKHDFFIFLNVHTQLNNDGTFHF